MKQVIVSLIVVVAIFVSGCASGEGYVRQGYNFGQVNKIAIVDVTGYVRGEVAKNQVADFFAMELLKKGYAPIERNQVQSVLEEQQFQAGDISSPEGAAQAGRILNVPAAVIINVSESSGEEIAMTAKMVDVEDGSILWIGSGSGSTGKTLGTIVGAAAGAAVGIAVAGEDDQVVGGIAGGVLGGVGGRALTPEKAQLSRKVVGKVCENLPPSTGSAPNMQTQQ